jgi:hypothetical protein
MDDPRRLYVEAEASAEAIKDALKKEYAESSEAKKLNELAEAVRRLEEMRAGVAQKKEPNQPPQTTRGKAPRG